MTISGLGSSFLSLQQYLEDLRNLDPDEMSKKYVKAKDIDGDGYLTADETGMSESDFAAADTDGDGLVSQAELSAHLARIIEEKSATFMSYGSQANLQSIISQLMSQAGTEEEGLSSADTISRMLGSIGLGAGDISAILGLLSQKSLDLQG